MSTSCSTTHCCALTGLKTDRMKNAWNNSLVADACHTLAITRRRVGAGSTISPASPVAVFYCAA
eukprot:14186470-Heterocapsa_arctica.AAC.1